jgi:glycosyltransferase involved in cell wall biosynthesis
MVLCYRIADVTWYKEPFMEPLLREARARRLFFLPNAVPVQDETANTSNRDIDFLWANRFIPTQRRPGWFVTAATQISSRVRCRTVVLGYLDESRASPEVLKEQLAVNGIADSNVDLLAFTDPTWYFERSRFFVLASTHVYGNNAVMEAMAKGVVPIVTCSPDVDLIVKSGWNGFVCEFDPEALRVAMELALQLDLGSWTVLSRNARAHVREGFGVTEWEQRLKELLDGVRDRSKQ